MWAVTRRIVEKGPTFRFHLYALADMQLDDTDRLASDILSAWVEEIVADPVPSGVVILGDITDDDRPSTRERKRGAFSDRPQVPERDARRYMTWCREFVIPKLRPLMQTKYGILGVLAGHHWVQISPVLNSVQYICQELERGAGAGRRAVGASSLVVPYLGEMSSYLDLRFGTGLSKECHSVRRVGHIQHGTGAGKAVGSSLRKLDVTAQGFDADFFVRAHDCQIESKKQDRIYLREKHDAEHDPEAATGAKQIALLNTGGAMRSYQVGRGEPHYAEKEMYRPSALGWGMLEFEYRKARRWEDPNCNYTANMRVTI